MISEHDKNLKGLQFEPKKEDLFRSPRDSNPRP